MRTSRRPRQLALRRLARPGLALYLAAGFVLPALGQEQTVAVTGTRLPQSASGLAQDITIIDQAQIQQANPGRLEDLLGRVTGAYVDQAGRAGGFSSMYMRGAENSHLLIMLDGVKLNDPTTTRGSAYDLSSIDVDTIDRIEVLRGPASAVYGGEALAGVIHIITKRGAKADVSGSGHLALGGQGHRKVGAHLAFGQGMVQGQLGLARSDDGHNSKASLHLDTVSAALRVYPVARLELELFGLQAQRQSAALPDDSGGPRLAPNSGATKRDSTDRSYGLKVNWGDARSLRVQAAATVFDRQERADNAAVDAGQRFPVPAFISNTDFQRTNVAASLSYDMGATAAFVAGLERQVEDGSLVSKGDFFGLGFPQTLDFALKRNTTAVFGEARLRLASGITAQIGLRHDKVDGIKAVTTPHLGLVWEPAAGTSIKTNYNEGFKPPSFFALGFPIGGNPNLRPERSKNLEFIVAQRLDAGSSLQVSVFQIRYQDLVDFDGNTFTNINRGRIVVRGIEPSLKWADGSPWSAQISATLLNIDEQDGLQPLRNRPERKLTGSLNYAMGANSGVMLALNHTGGYLDRSNPTGDILMPGYATLDAAYRVQFGNLRFNLSLDNLLNKHYEQFVGFPSQGRRLRAALRLGF